jgi:tripartite-type tricarboxylate transporter receptor subunit TctC
MGNSSLHRRSILKVAAAFPLWSAAGPALAQSGYPDRPIKVIVPYLAGGATDVGARVVAERMAKGLGQPMVIDNRPGAGVIVGTNAVAKADPDGYTVLITTLAHPINITLQKKLPYDSIADFEPVALMGIINFILVVHPSSPIVDLPSLIAYLKANPDKATYGSAGTGSPMHLGPELFKSLTGVTANHVPYRGEAAALNDMIGGRLTFMLSGTPTVAPHIQAGTVRALATPSPKRSTLVPQVPTTAEAGLPQWQTYSCIMMLAPKGTPRAIVERLNREANAAMASDDVKLRLAQLGIDAVESSTPESTAAFIREEAEKWAPIVKSTGAQVE